MSPEENDLLKQYEERLQEKAQPKSLLELVQPRMEHALSKKPLLSRVEAARDTRVLCPDIFEVYSKDHRQHQTNALETIRECDKGQIIIPTGTGKTRLQIHVHVEDMLQKSEQDETGVYVIAAHRLLLCKQLMDELRDLCFNIKLPINTLYIGSARQDDKEVYERYFREGLDSSNFKSFYTTSGEEVKKFYEETKSQNRHLVIVSTYHSFDKLAVIPAIDITTYDEAHTTVSEDFTENIAKVEPNVKRSYFFTATRKVHGEDKGMNNMDRYGPIAFGIPPREMIEAGEILMPRLHLIKFTKEGETVPDRDEKTLVKTVTEGFEEHRERLKNDSAAPEKIGAKLLVSAKGSAEIKILQDSKRFQDWAKKTGVKVFSFSTKYGSFEDFKEIPNRNHAYESMKNLKDDEDAIILHIDILTEGIDLPSITAVMLLRHLNVIRLMQTLGRALRLLKSDRERFYKGELSPENRDQYTKPFAYLLLPMHFESLNATSEEMKAMIKKVIAEYGLPTEEFLPIEQFDDMEFDGLDPVTDREKILKRQKDYPLVHIIEDIVMEEFTKDLPESSEEKYQAITAMLKELVGNSPVQEEEVS